MNEPKQNYDFFVSFMVEWTMNAIFRINILLIYVKKNKANLCFRTLMDINNFISAMMSIYLT